MVLKLIFEVAKHCLLVTMDFVQFRIKGKVELVCWGEGLEWVESGYGGSWLTLVLAATLGQFVLGVAAHVYATNVKDGHSCSASGEKLCERYAECAGT